MASNKYDTVPSSLTLEPNPFEQSFASKPQDGRGGAPGDESMHPLDSPAVPPGRAQHDRQKSLPGVHDLTSPSPLLAAGGAPAWPVAGRGPHLSPMILNGGEGTQYGLRDPTLPSPGGTVLSTPLDHQSAPPGPLGGSGRIAPAQQVKPVYGENQAANGLYMLSHGVRESKIANNGHGQHTPDPSSSALRVPATAEGQRRLSSSKPADDTDDQEDRKRQQFLERNRLAAVKCRQRKKQYMNSLKTKVEYLMATNDELTGEVAKLRTHMDQLRAFLASNTDLRRLPPAIRAIMENRDAAAPPQQMPALVTNGALPSPAHGAHMGVSSQGLAPQVLPQGVPIASSTMGGLSAQMPPANSLENAPPAHTVPQNPRVGT